MSLKLEDFDSPFAQLYLALQEYIKTAVPAIKQVALDIGQLDYYDIRPAVAFPCLLIDFPASNFTDEGELVQWGNLTIQTRLGFSPFSKADSITPDISVKAALQFFEIENNLFKKLHGWSPTLKDANNNDVEICQPISRLSAVKEMREDPFIVRVNMWSTAGEDAGALVVKEKVKAKLELS